MWNAAPLYLRILIGLALGVVTGLALGERAQVLEVPAKLILQLLSGLAPPLILVVVVNVLMTAEIRGAMTRRLAFLLVLNTTVAILIGLGVANVLRPGEWSDLEPPAKAPAEAAAADAGSANPLMVLIDSIPKSLLGPLGDKPNVIGVVIIAVAFGMALRRYADTPVTNPRQLVAVLEGAMLVVLHWVIQLVPFGVFGVVAKVVGVSGFGPFAAMAAFVVSVLVALLLQACWYLLRIRMFSWCRPLSVLRDMRDALVMAFSTASSTATMPVTYECLREKVGLREESASMGALVGANFNNDGTGLYEAMAALFIAQLLGQDLTTIQQLLIVLTSIIASVGAAGIPNAGLVTMTLVFNAVNLPLDYIPLLLTVDWFLDRCRTAINVLGDVNVSCLLDGRQREAGAQSVAPSPEPPSLGVAAAVSE